MPSLTLDRIFNDPELSGSPPESLKFSPDSRYVSFLKPAEDDFERLDIWAFETQTGQSSLLVESSQLAFEHSPMRKKLYAKESGFGILVLWNTFGHQILSQFFFRSVALYIFIRYPTVH